MAFVAGTRGALVPAVDRRLAEEELQVVTQRGLLALGHEQEVASSVRDIGTERALRVQGIRAEMMRPLTHTGLRNCETMESSFSLSPTTCSLSTKPVWVSYKAN